MNNGNFYGQMNYSGQYGNPAATQPMQNQYPSPIRQEARPVFPLQSISGGNASMVIRVPGDEEAYSYLVAPGCEVPMFNYDNTRAFIKSVDVYNRPKLRRFRMEEIFDDVAEGQAQNPLGSYVTRQEYEGLLSEHNKLCSLMQKMAERLEGVKHDEPETE